MDFVKKAIWGPDPKEQYRKCQQQLRKNKRQMDRQIQDLNTVEKKSKSLIKQAAKKNDMKAARFYAKELRNTQKVNERMHVSRATLDSIELKLNEQQQLIKLKGSLQKSTGIMQDMNQLVRVPQISRTVQELSKELVKSGVIDEMVSDALDSAEWEDEDLDENEEINDILTEILDSKDKVNNTENNLDNNEPLFEPEDQTAVEADDDDDDEDLIKNMRQRLTALQQ
ncbi:Vacuolar protein-sorting-associated protein 24 [Pichia californica]|uniref:Vacuolar protein-sorting-associated protein 24 n=1 Tax=Pichia californica TaxID=460514 RepID=A0A9P6WLU3_9ASCO|nr:Vacuolar protein-sorting-associated protein 24 [[Candida] californica]KAG0688423.1 Vacuolar protein-sorting-associated protein 24 [[Candida] californica]